MADLVNAVIGAIAIACVLFLIVASPLVLVFAGLLLPLLMPVLLGLLIICIVWEGLTGWWRRL